MRKGYRLLIIYFLALLVCVLIIYAVPSLTGLLERTYIAEPGEVELSYIVDGYIVRDEVVYTAEKGGRINRLVKPGVLVKGGSSVVEISGKEREDADTDLTHIIQSLGDDAEASSGATATAGYISYYVDGAEGKLKSETLDSLTEANITDYTSVSTQEMPAKTTAKGEPLFKTVKNGEWWIVFFTDEKGAASYEEGERVRITIGEDSAKAYVKSIKKQKEGKYRVVLKCNVFLEGYLDIRTTEVTITTESAKGLLINKESIVTKDKQQGVIVKNKIGKNVFKPIYIKADDGTTCAVCEDYYMDENGNFVETLKVYDEIVTSPSEKEIKESE